MIPIMPPTYIDYESIIPTAFGAQLCMLNETKKQSLACNRVVKGLGLVYQDFIRQI